jgi:Secretory lipase
VAASTSSFYAVPAPPPSGRPGDVIKRQSMTANKALTVSMLGTTATRMMYRSTDRNGHAVAVTGTVLVPTAPWTGPGQRPLVAFALGMHGIDDYRASSRMLANGTDYEANLIQPLVLAGYAVAITDYLGVGTTNYEATYMDRVDQAHAVLDAARAAQRLGLPGVPSHGPVLTWGYSQGGEGSGAALELAPTYAPDLHIIGGYAGSIPDDLAAVSQLVDGQYSAFLMGSFMNAYNNVDPQLSFTDLLTPAGLKFMQTTATQCAIPDAVPANLLANSATSFKDGRTLAQHLSDAAWRAPTAARKLGTQGAPTVPVLVGSSTGDDIVPHYETRNVVVRWCGRGATVEFAKSIVPGHIPGAYALSPVALAWVRARIEGTPAVSNCGHF